MYFADNYRRIGSIDVAGIRQSIEALGSDAWDATAYRQRKWAVHAHTRSIPLIYDDDLRHENPTRRPMMDRFEAATKPAMDCIRAHFAPVHAAVGSPAEEGYFVRVILAKLAGGGEIAAHTDAMPSLTRCHRIHLPILTNPSVEFWVNGDIRHLPEGELWEINNRRSHAVRNLGADRIHAIFDYVIPGETIEDPDCRIVA